MGKYDTYKGSTLIALSLYLYDVVPWGNMILIKDRHISIRVIEITVNLFGKYDTYKGSTPNLQEDVQSRQNREI